MISLDKSKVKGIIFDLDGTLYRMKWYMKPMITMKLFPHCLRLPQFLKVRDTFAGKDMHDGESLLDAIAENLRKKIRHCTIRQLSDWIKIDFYRQFEAVMPFMKGGRPGLMETLEKLRNLGIKLAVLSDFSKVKERLILLGINPAVFNNIESAELAGSLKPSPLPFLSIAGKWDIMPENILVIGDRMDTDGISAKNANMMFIQITDKRKSDTKAETWEEIKDFLLDFQK